VVYPSHIDDKPIAVQKRAWIVFDNIFFIYDPDQSLFSSHPVTLLQPNSDRFESRQIDLIVDTPFQLVPEHSFNEYSKGIIMHAIHPYSRLQNQQIKVDTWSSQYIKCIYYLPKSLQQLNTKNYLHWMSCVERWSRRFFDKVHTGMCSIRIFDHIYILIQVEKSLKEALKLHVPSPDDSSYFLLKLIEKYKAYQEDFTLFTNEKAPAHIRILKKYLYEVEVLKWDQDDIIPEIIRGV